ncbi:hypothetical protein PMG11_08510 [Penicillium brasilianum]|uniref:Uncharacterized protein n=1 Tax=Penicillium brasilianum TaxID=104259 RepID=A0A0F7TWY5_PENBI|nr:hypothetical protein PMG11_08510 [Penicillium brasilianum]
MYSHLRATGSSVTGVHIEAQEDLSIVDRILEPQTIPHFMEFMLGQPLPDGTRPSSIGTLSPDELPFVQQSQPSGPDGESIMNCVMSRIGSLEDGSRLCLVGKNIQFLKSRLWEGITPLSDQRWQENGLHLSENFHVACQHLSAVVAVFEYLNTNQVRNNLRQTFNLIYEHWETLDTLVNRKRAEKGEEPISVANNWTIYIANSYKVMTQNAHSWVTRHIDALRAPLLQGILNHQPLVEGNGVADETQWDIMDRLHMLLEISVRADYGIMMPMNGYKGYTAPKNGSGPAEMYVADLTKRGEVYSSRLKSLSHQIMYQRILGGAASGRRRSETSGESYHASAMDQLQAQNQVRRELRGDSHDSISQEPWMTYPWGVVRRAEKKNELKNCGLAIYRLTYEQSESEWTEFVKKLEAHISDWGSGQSGSDLLKPHLKLHWVDGKELGLAEDDIQAAREHFNKLMDDKNNDKEGGINDSQRKLPLKLQSNAFLAVDSASFASYTTDIYGAPASEFLPGDFAGFVLAIDPHFGPEQGAGRPDESPGYIGHMRIVGCLVWGEMYAFLEAQSALLEDMWPLAMYHPYQVYVGPTVPLQVFKWRAHNAIRWNVLREALQLAKRALGL